MKIVYLSQARLPTRNAHGFQIMNTCSSLSKEKIEVLLLVPQRKNVVKDSPFDFYHLPRSFNIKKLPVIDLYPLRFIPESVSGFFSSISFLVSARLYLFFFHYDILFTREDLSRFFFKNYVYEIHMPEQLKFGGFKPKKIIVISNHIKSVLLKKGFKEKDILVSPDAVNLSMFQNLDKLEARRRLNLPKDKKIVMYWGNFKAWKGIDTLAESVKYMRNYFIVMIGGTKDTDIARIRKMVTGENNVLVEGFKDQELLPTYLASADVLVLPNTAKDENSRLFTSPLKLFEYMASRRPIVASNVPALREILNDSNAMFFNPDDPKNLARTVELTLQDNLRAQNVANQAFKDVERYTWDKRAKAIIEFLNK